MSEMMLLKTLSSEFEMEIVKQKLDELGIETFAQSNDMDNLLPAMDYATGVRLYVNEEDFETAHQIITSEFDDLDDDMEVGVVD